MSYVKAESILPRELLTLVQEYADGQYLYIPKKEENYKSWGENTNSRQAVRQRDTEIYSDYLNGICIPELAAKYYLSSKSIQRIVLQEKRCRSNNIR